MCQLVVASVPQFGVGLAYGGVEAGLPTGESTLKHVRVHTYNQAFRPQSLSDGQRPSNQKPTKLTLARVRGKGLVPQPTRVPPVDPACNRPQLAVHSGAGVRRGFGLPFQSGPEYCIQALAK